jgi:hypothetical protein
MGELKYQLLPMRLTPFLVYTSLHSMVGDKLKSKVIALLEAKK